MKRFICLIYVCLLIFGFSHTYALDVAEEQIGILNIDDIYSSLSSEARRYVQDIDIGIDMDIGSEAIELINNISRDNLSAFKSAFRIMSRIAIIVVICGLANGFSKSSGIASLGSIINISGALSISLVILMDVKSLINIAIDAIDQLFIFSKAMMPVMATAMAMGGASARSAVSLGVTAFSYDFLITFINNVLVPCIFAYIAIITVNAASGNNILGKISDFIKWISTSSLKLILTVFIAYISISGITAGSIDSVALKTAKFAVSSVVPVVGGIISDATETFLTGALLIKNSLGIFGILIILVICMAPFLEVFVCYLTFKAGIAVLSPIMSGDIERLVEGFGDSFGMILAMLGTGAAVLFFELVFIIVMVKPV